MIIIRTGQHSIDYSWRCLVVKMEIFDITDDNEGCLYRDGTFCVPIEGLGTLMKYLDLLRMGR